MQISRIFSDLCDRSRFFPLFPSWATSRAESGRGPLDRSRAMVGNGAGGDKDPSMTGTTGMTSSMEETPRRLAVVVDVAQLRGQVPEEPEEEESVPGPRPEPLETLGLDSKVKLRTNALVSDVAVVVAKVVGDYRQRVRNLEQEVHHEPSGDRGRGRGNESSSGNQVGIQWTFRIFDSTESLMATEKSLGLLARAMEKEGALCSGMTAATPNPQFEDFEYSSFRSFLRLLQRFGAENRATSTSASAKAKENATKSSSSKSQVDGLQQVSRCLTGVMSKMDQSTCRSWVLLFSDCGKASCKTEDPALVRIAESLQQHRASLKWLSPRAWPDGRPAEMPRGLAALEEEAVVEGLRRERSERRGRGEAVLRGATSLDAAGASASGWGNAAEKYCHDTAATPAHDSTSMAEGRERTKDLLDKSLKSYQLDLRLMQPSFERRAKEKERERAGGEAAEAAAMTGPPAPHRPRDPAALVSDARLELQSFYGNSETGLRPGPVVRRCVCTIFSHEKRTAHDRCRQLFVPRSALREKYGKGYQGTKDAKVREYLTQVLLRLASASAAMAEVEGSKEEAVLTRADLREVKQMLKDVMFAMPAATPGSGVKEFLEQTVSPSFPLLEASVLQLKANFGLASQPRQRRRAAPAPAAVAGVEREGQARKQQKPPSSSKSNLSRASSARRPRRDCGTGAAGGGTIASLGGLSLSQQSSQGVRFHGNLARQVSLKLRANTQASQGGLGAAKAAKRAGRQESGRENKKPCVRKDAVLETPFLKKFG